jgi:ribonuclease HII
MLIPPKNVDSSIEVGVDEAGRGCLWGPLYAAAVLLSENQEEWPVEFVKIVDSIKDSKLISPKKRKVLYNVLKTCGIVYGIGSVSANEVDSLGATKANQLAFRRAIDNISSEKRVKIHILIDGCLGLREEKEGETWATIVDGDAKYLSIATASIFAKESHDSWLETWCSKHKDVAEMYDLASCKGYGTLKHRNGVKQHGLHEEHRRLYCRKLIPGLVVNRYEFTD